MRISKHVQELPGRSHSQHSSQSVDTVWLQPCGLSPGADGQPVQGRAGAPLSAGQCRVLEAGRASPRPPAVRPPARPRPLDSARKDLFDHILISELLPALTFVKNQLKDQRTLFDTVSVKQRTLASLPFLIVPDSSDPTEVPLNTSIGEMFAVRDSCVIQSDSWSGLKDLPSCHSSAWSSVAPDPKSELTGGLYKSR